MWVSRASRSSDEPPTPEQMHRWRCRISPPENELPAVVGPTLLLGRSDDAAVGITQIGAFSTGFQFTLAVRVRSTRPELAHGGLHLMVGGHTHPGIEITLEQRLLLGLEYPDGQRASTLRDMRMHRPGPTEAGQPLILVQHRGGGGEQGVDHIYWVSPLPPDGPVTFVLAWPAFGLPESRTVLDGAAIRAAAASSQVLWPPEPPLEPAPPPAPPRPSSGWFAESAE